MACLVCHKQRITTRHHYLWPKKKKKWQRGQMVQLVCNSCHQGYHNRYMGNGCQDGCRNMQCEYAIICFQWRLGHAW
jgi:hypothetical protein